MNAHLLPYYFYMLTVSAVTNDMASYVVYLKKYDKLKQEMF